MKAKLKFFLRWAGIFLFCFLVVYLTVFFGGWKLFESGDPILIEIGVALILSIFILAISEVITNLEKRVKTLEENIKNLEKELTNK